MKRFSVYPIGMPDMPNTWLDTGFSLYPAEQDASERPDVLLIGKETTCSKLLESIQVHMPKVVIGAGYESLELTAALKEIYQLHTWKTEGMCYCIATSIEAELESPQWHLYSEEGDARHKGVSDNIYRHLLYEVFRETREWCGHTFSVVTGL